MRDTGEKVESTLRSASILAISNQIRLSPEAEKLTLLKSMQPSIFTQIFIKLPTGKSLTLKIPLSTNISSLKRILHEREGIPIKDQRLVFKGRELGESPSLSHYNVNDLSTIFLHLRLRGGVEISVQNKHGDLKFVDVDPFTTVLQLKEMIDGNCETKPRESDPTASLSGRPSAVMAREPLSKKRRLDDDDSDNENDDFPDGTCH